MKNPYIIPAAMISAAILGGFWMLKPASEPQKVIVVQKPDISIHRAISNGNIEAVKQHLDAGTDVNAKFRVFKSTPLHNAASGGHKEIAELLIAKGADVNAKTRSGQTPLDQAIQYKHPEVADFLRKHGGKTAVRKAKEN